jgi:hypothetical protein
MCLGSVGLAADHVAEELGFSREWVTHLCREGPERGGLLGHQTRPRGPWLISRAAVDDYKLAQRSKG